MALGGTTWETEDLGGGQFRRTQYLRRIAYRDGGILHRIVNDWTDSGSPARPHIVTAAPFLVSASSDGMRRIHPTRELGRYVEVGAPYAKVGGVWTQVSLGAPERTGNLLQWTTANANVYTWMGGHFVKLAILLKGGWEPEDGQFAFPIGLNGLTRSGNQLLADGEPVVNFRTPIVYDYDDPDDRRNVASQFVQFGGEWYALFTLPDLSGMSRPLIDPTLTLQPDETDGTDTYAQTNMPDTAYDTFVHLRIRTQAAEWAGGLIKFDVSSIAGLTVSSATLYLYQATAATNTNVEVWAVASANDGWIEACTWNYADGAGASQRWAGDTGNDGGPDAGCTVSGTDYTTPRLGVINVLAADPSGTEYSTSLTTSAVQAWVNGNNYGMVLWPDVTWDQCYLHSSSSATAGYRPKLAVDYTVAGGALLMMHHYRLRRAG